MRIASLLGGLRSRLRRLELRRGLGLPSRVAVVLVDAGESVADACARQGIAAPGAGDHLVVVEPDDRPVPAP